MRFRSRRMSRCSALVSIDAIGAVAQALEMALGRLALERADAVLLGHQLLGEREVAGDEDRHREAHLLDDPLVQGGDLRPARLGERDPVALPLRGERRAGRGR